MPGTLKKLIHKAWMHKGLRHYGANTIWLFAEKAVRMLVGFTVGIYVARQLGPQKYGLLNYAISLVAIFSVIAGLGLDQIVIRELVKTPENRDKLLGTTFLLKLIGVILMLLGLGTALFFTSNDRNTNIIILIIAGGYLFQIFQTIDFYFQANVLSKYVAISQTIAWLLVSAGRAFFAWRGYPLIYFAWLEAMNMALMSVGYLFFYFIKVSHPFRWHFDSKLSKALLKNSWPLLLSGAAGMIYMRIDQVMIKSMLGETENGYYAVAVRFIEIWYFVPMIICSSLFPSIVRAKEISQEHYRHRLQMLFTLMFWLAICIALTITFIFPYFIEFFLPQYNNSVPIMLIYSWKTIFCFMGVASSNYFINEDLQKYCLIFAVFGAITNIILNYFLIKRLGAPGCAWASLIASGTVVYLGPLLFKPTRNIFGILVKVFYLKNHINNSVVK